MPLPPGARANRPDASPRIPRVGWRIGLLDHPDIAARIANASSELGPSGAASTPREAASTTPIIKPGFHHLTKNDDERREHCCSIRRSMYPALSRPLKLKIGSTRKRWRRCTTGGIIIAKSLALVATTAERGVLGHGRTVMLGCLGRAASLSRQQVWHSP